MKKISKIKGKDVHVSSCHQVADILANKWLGLPLFSKHTLKNIHTYIYIYIYVHNGIN